MSTFYAPIQLLKSKFVKSDINTGKKHISSVVGFHLYDENAVITNLLRKLFVKTKIMGAKPIMLLMIDYTTYALHGQYHTWTAHSSNGDVFRIIHVDGAYDIFYMKSNQNPELIGTAKYAYFPVNGLIKSSPYSCITLYDDDFEVDPRARATDDQSSVADDLISHVINTSRTHYSSASS